MIIENCPKCGGTHVGSYDCPITNPAKATPWPRPIPSRDFVGVDAAGDELAPPPPLTQGEELERKLFYDDRGIYIGDTRAQAIRTLIYALNLAVARGCDHCAETIRQARALAAAEPASGEAKDE